VLAAVQAFVLKHLLFGGKKGDSKKYIVFQIQVYMTFTHFFFSRVSFNTRTMSIGLMI